MEGESSEISAIDFSAVEKNISKRALSEEEVRAQKTLVILKSKDTKLLELQSRLKYLEKLAGKIDNCDENQHLKRKMSSEKISSAGDFLSSSETQNSHEQQDSETSMVEDSASKNYENSFVQTDLISNPSPDGDNQLRDLQTHSELYQVISKESELRLKDQKKFCKILDNFHQMLRAIKRGSEFPSEMSLIKLYQNNEEEDLSQSLISVALMSNESKGKGKLSKWNLPQNREQTFYPATIKNSNTCARVQTPSTEKNVEVSFIEKLYQVETDMEEVNSLLKTSEEKISSEQKAQRTLHSAWCARFKIHLNKMQRLEKRYRKVCRYLMDTRKNMSKRKLRNTRSEEGRRLSSKESGSTKQNDDEGNIETIGLLRGRLDAAHTVMNKQKSQLLELQSQIENQNNQMEKLKQRLLRSEMKNASKESLDQNKAQQYDDVEKKCQDVNERYNLIQKESDELKYQLQATKIQMMALKNQYNKAVEENDAHEVRLIESKTKTEREMLLISKELVQEKGKAKSWEDKYNQLHKYFIKNTQAASERITAANKKLKEFFKTVEAFLKLVSNIRKSSAIVEAEQIASSILKISTNDVQKIISTTIKQHDEVQIWLEEFKYLISKESFSDELARFLYSVSIKKADNL